ncbi:DEAD/DEAH box helicase [Alkalihalobacterium alkalinitrilicum]|uniref:DEAD/DEAH box helicase n=1 Tax=Alkalihalobacterium alkalinitrilicum TaxID=427920 RepID=UPI000994FC0A|nr:DEAD/DEAH box helicase [Alkalihalobacterium alkalinitrilicum]
MTNSNFSRFDLQAFLIEAITAQGFSLPTEIQERLIPAIRSGKDVIGQSQTGSGKTLAFLLPIVDMINTDKAEVQTIITAPTRELATQIFNELKKLLDHQEEQTIQAKLLVGGTDRTRMIDKLEKAQPHIVVGTPGRINDLVSAQALGVQNTSMLVVDEADQMLDMGFIEDVDKLASRMAVELQMLIFSATIPEKLQPFLRKYMNNPRHVHVKPEHATAPTIEHRLISLRHRNKIEVTIEVAKIVNPYLAIIFTNTKEQADEVADAMQTAGLNVGRLHGGLQARERKQIMKQVNDVKIQYLVATDLAARGMDIKGITHIINYNIPKDLDFYIHRVGRTARAGKEGLAVTIYEPQEQEAIEKLMKRGINFIFADIKNGELIKLEKPKFGGNKPKSKSTVSSGKALAKPKKVKPGYKKKARYLQEKKEKRDRRLNRKK